MINNSELENYYLNGNENINNIILRNLQNNLNSNLKEKIDKNILIWNLNDFQINANEILPAETKIYYKKSNGQTTGIYKICDGINTVYNIPIQYEIWNYAPYPSNNFINLINNWKINYLNGTIENNNSDTAEANINLYGSLDTQTIFIPFPLELKSYTMKLNSFTIGGYINLALYSLNINGTGTLVSNSHKSKLITSAGYQKIDITPHLILEPGIYLLVYYQHGGAFISAATTTSIKSNLCYIYMPDGSKKNYANFNITPTFPENSIGSIDIYNTYLYYIKLEYNRLI